MTQQAIGPNLFDILLQLRQDNTHIRAELQAIRQEITAFRTLLAKRRLPTGTEPIVSLADIAQGMQKRLDWHFQQLARPLPYHHLGRAYARKLSLLNATVEQAVALMPNAHSFASGSGGRMVVPKDAWDGLNFARQNEWLGTTERELERMRKIDIETMNKVASDAANEIRKEQRQVFETSKPLQEPSTGVLKSQQSSKAQITQAPLEGRVVINPAEAFSSEGEDPFAPIKQA